MAGWRAWAIARVARCAALGAAAALSTRRRRASRRARRRRHVLQKVNAGLEQLLHKYDENGDGVLSLKEFTAMCSRLNRDAPEESVQALFMEVQEASERIDASVGDSLLPQAFVQVMHGTQGFIDGEAFLEFLREMCLMPQEDE